MSSCAFSIAPATGIYRANDLGLRVPSLKPSASIPRRGDEECIGERDGTVRVRSYEASQIPGYVASPMDGTAGHAYGTMRIVRSCDGFAIGTATCSDTGEVCGFLLRVTEFSERHVIVSRLQQTFFSGDVYTLTYPRALVLRHGKSVVTIVGEGRLNGSSRHPAVAHVRLNTQPHVEVDVILGSDEFADASGSESDEGDGDGDGSGSDGDSRKTALAACESRGSCVYRVQPEYYDVIRTPTDSSAVYVCGSADGAAAVFLIDDSHGIVKKMTRLCTRGAGKGSVATCLTLSACKKLLVVGVQTAATSSLVWALAADTMQQLHSLSTCAFNDRATKRLRLPHEAVSVDVLRLFALPCGSFYALATAWFSKEREECRDDTETPTPTAAVAVYRFTADTEPEVDFGVYGISLWFDAHGVETRPCDAVVHKDSLYVTGNVYLGEGADAEEPIYVNPCMSFLSVNVRSPPSPFLLQFRRSGVPCAVFLGLDGCAQAHFANTVSLAPNSCSALVVLGDVWFHLGKPSQAAGLLVVDIALQQPPRIMNAQYISVPVIDFGRCCEPVTIDKKCVETTLQVAGPIIVGCPPVHCASILPGAIAYDATCQAFVGFDGVSWKKFQMTDKAH